MSDSNQLKFFNNTQIFFSPYPTKDLSTVTKLFSQCITFPTTSIFYISKRKGNRKKYDAAFEYIARVKLTRIWKFKFTKFVYLALVYSRAWQSSCCCFTMSNFSVRSVTFSLISYKGSDVSRTLREKFLVKLFPAQLHLLFSATTEIFRATFASTKAQYSAVIAVVLFADDAIWEKKMGREIIRWNKRKRGDMSVIRRAGQYTG